MKDNAKLIENNSNSSLDSGKILSKLANLKYYDIVIQIFKYFWVSLLAAIADFTLFMALYEWIGVWYIAANTAGFALGVYINYTLSTIFVFKGQSTKTWSEFIIFTIIGLAGLAVSNITLYLTIDIMGLGGGISKIIAICSAFFWNFSRENFYYLTERNERSISEKSSDSRCRSGRIDCGIRN